MHAPIIQDMGFGDGGKGKITDAVARHFGITLNVRFNGGAQAAHAVETPEGQAHSFHQFGSATFCNNVDTLLSRYMMVNPLALWREGQELEKLGMSNSLSRIYIDAQALITTPYHVAINRLRELGRGQNRHGSCGMGIGETMSDCIAFPDLVIRAVDILQPSVFAKKLAWLRDLKLQQVAEISVENSPEQQSSLQILHSNQEFDDALEVLAIILQRCHVVDGRTFLRERLKTEPVIFEGAQGILLDQDWGFHPHTTWSTTTSDNARTLIAETGLSVKPTIIGITRAYQTRHGNGPFPSESVELNKLLEDRNNPTNDWQGVFRFGWLDMVLNRYAIKVNRGIDCLAVSCLDDLTKIRQPLIATAYDLCTDLSIGTKGNLAHQEKLTALLQNAVPILQEADTQSCYAETLAEILNAPLAIKSFGRTHTQTEFLI